MHKKCLSFNGKLIKSSNSIRSVCHCSICKRGYRNFEMVSGKIKMLSIRGSGESIRREKYRNNKLILLFFGISHTNISIFLNRFYLNVIAFI